jgi:hypothetical protein
MTKLIVDGKEIDVPAEFTLLQACEAAGLEIPRRMSTMRTFSIARTWLRRSRTLASFIRLSIWLPGLALLACLPAVPLHAKDVGADVSSLCQFVSQKKVLTLRYNYDPKDAKPRILSPYAVGYTKRNDMLLLAYQAEGYSKSGGGEGSGWRNFRTDKIAALTDDPGTFIAVKPKRSEYKYIDRFECKNAEVSK